MRQKRSSIWELVGGTPNDDRAENDGDVALYLAEMALRLMCALSLVVYR